MESGREEYRNLFRAMVLSRIDGSVEMDDEALRLLIEQTVRDYCTAEHRLTVSERRQAKKDVFDSLRRLDVIQDLMEDPAGLEMKIKRNYYRLVPEVQEALAAGLQGSVQTLKRDKYKRVPLKSGDVIRPGELVEVEIISTAKNDYDYVCFADSMPAGFEFEKPVSGYDWTGRAPIYREYRERGAKFYLRNMARGDSNVFYRMRAQLPGRFIALPAGGSGVYAPELKCNSDQHIFVISE